jgi:hypothetical protein
LSQTKRLRRVDDVPEPLPPVTAWGLQAGEIPVSKDPRRTASVLNFGQTAALVLPSSPGGRTLSGMLGARINPIRVPPPVLELMMNPAVQLARLAQAERRIASGIRHIEKQEQIIADLERNGRDNAAALAVELLTIFHRTQAYDVAHRDRILKDLER